MAANHSTVWQTASSTHWQCPPKLRLSLMILWLFQLCKRDGASYFWPSVPIREDKGRATALLRVSTRADRLLSGVLPGAANW